MATNVIAHASPWLTVPKPGIAELVVEDDRDVPMIGRVARSQGLVYSLRDKWLLKGDPRSWDCEFPLPGGLEFARAQEAL